MKTTAYFLAACVLLTGRARANDFAGSVRAEMAEAAKQIVAVMADVNQQSVEIGQFVPVGNNPANGGPGLRLELIQALEAKKKGCVKEGAFLAVQGKFLRVNDPADQTDVAAERLMAERLNLELIDKGSGDTVKGISVFIRQLREIASLEGINVHIKSPGDTRSEHKELREQAEHPAPLIEENGTRIRSHAGSPYSLKIGIKPVAQADTSPLKFGQATLEKGCPFVKIDKGEVYELYFFNDSEEEVGARIKIDGIDVFTYSKDRNPETDRPKFTHWVVGKHGSLELPGWHVTNSKKTKENYLRFLVTEYGKGAASQLPTAAQGNIGVITVEVGLSKAIGKGRSGAETGFGPPVAGNLTEVKRSIDPPHDFISVRYIR